MLITELKCALLAVRANWCVCVCVCVCVFADLQRIRLNIANVVCQSAVQYKFTKQYAN